jgi:hypothetical protein
MITTVLDVGAEAPLGPPTESADQVEAFSQSPEAALYRTCTVPNELVSPAVYSPSALSA